MACVNRTAEVPSRRMLRLKHTTSLFEALDLFQLAKSQLGGVLDENDKVRQEGS